MICQNEQNKNVSRKWVQINITNSVTKRDWCIHWRSVFVHKSEVYKAKM